MMHSTKRFETKGFASALFAMALTLTAFADASFAYSGASGAGAGASGAGASGTGASGTGSSGTGASGTGSSGTGSSGTGSSGTGSSGTGASGTGSSGTGSSGTGSSGTGSSGTGASGTGSSGTGSSGTGSSGTGGGDGGGGGGTGPGPSGNGAPHFVAPAPIDDVALSCGLALNLPDPSSYGAPDEAVKAISRATRTYIDRCNCHTQKCIADALDRYAEALAEVAPRLPPKLRNLPAIVASAARRVRIARTKVEAVKILKVAVATVQKEIKLIRVENPDALPRETRAADFVAGTLEKAALSLERPAAF